MSDEDDSTTYAWPKTNLTAPDANGSFGLEALACVSCRGRKLKCDRTKPACTRCVKVKADCVYPESRRKPAFKRRNVKELEQRLAQVEVLLRDAAGGAETTGQIGTPRDNGPRDANREIPTRGTGTYASSQKVPEDPLMWSYDTGVPSVNGNLDKASPGGHGTDPGAGVPFSVLDMRHRVRPENSGATNYELLGLGLFEALPPAEMIEDLHHTFFTRQHPLIPIVHPARYMQAFYSAPHLRPPMALRYAIWTMATNGHEKYSSYHEAFHRRCRHYLEQDELRGDGEHFLTIAHAQAWAIAATDEARCMWFTRAAMSTARCVKLCHMMGLHKLDDPDGYEMVPTIAPPKDWTECEERRRVFWGAFAVDSHASVSTGWPSLINIDEVTTHLPSSEEAFNQCREEQSYRLEDVFTGSSYSSFASAAIICHIFNQIMKHVHSTKPDDQAKDFDYGVYWKRHRQLDNMISSAFMFLPERFRFPKNFKDPVAVHMNLNLHASTICLHNNANEMAHKHNLPEQVKMMSTARLLMAAQEVVNIVKLTSHANAGYKSPLVALALYVSSSVYISQAQEDGLQSANTSNIEFLITAMHAIGRQHAITRSFLCQALLDVEMAGLRGLVRVPKLDGCMTTARRGRVDPGDVAPCGHNIPLFARSRISRHTDVLPPLPGRLPLERPVGTTTTTTVSHARGPFCSVDDAAVCGAGTGPRGHNSNNNNTGSPSSAGPAIKRKRVAVSPELSLGGNIENDKNNNNNASVPWQPFTSSTAAVVKEKSSSSPDNNLPRASSLSLSSYGPGGSSCLLFPPRRAGLPHRGGSSTTTSSGSSFPSPCAAGWPTATATTTRDLSVMGTIVAGDGEGSGSGVVEQGLVYGSEATGAVSSSTASVDTPQGAMDTMNMFQDLNGWDMAGESMEAQGSGFLSLQVDDDNWMMLNNVGGNGAWDAGGGGGMGVG